MFKCLPILLALLLLSCSGTKKSVTSTEAPQVILKLDDLKYEKGLVHPGWLQVIDFLNEEKITGTIGLIGNSLETEDERYFQWIKDRQAEGYEIWHHGYCHCKPMVSETECREFRGTSYDYQLDNLQRTQQLAQQKLNISFQTFGAPYNSTDANTVKALTQIPEIKIWLYQETSFSTEKFVFKRIPEVNIEYPVHIPRVKKLKQGFRKYRQEPVLVIQGHPRSWVDDKKRFRRFKRMMKYLKKEGVQFTTPTAYYEMNQL